MPQALRLRRPRRRRDGGFTLIELLIVIVILGILAAVVVFAVNGIQNKGTTAACKADLQSVSTAAEAYNAQKGVYASGIQALVSAGFLHSLPSSSSYTISYVVNPGNPPAVPISVSVTSTSCTL